MNLLFPILAVFACAPHKSGDDTAPPVEDTGRGDTASPEETGDTSGDTAGDTSVDTAGDTSGDTAGDTSDDTADTADSGGPTLYGTAPEVALPIPEFTVRNQDGEPRDASALLGHPTVMWFYPVASTAG